MSTMPPSDTLVQQIAELVETRTGIAIRTHLRDALHEIIGSLAGDDMAGYYERLRQHSETDGEWQQLVSTLTIGETYFLRDQAHFDLLRRQLLPEIIARRRAEGDLYLNIWSVGCATGEEPYSLAITLYELLPDITNWRIHLIGSDINAQALHAARRGVYRQWSFRHTDADFQQTYFEPTPTGLQIRPHIRKLVTFRHANLFRPAHVPAFPFDLILCRNVLLYFDSTHVQQAETTFHHVLAAGGWLLLGRAEVIRATAERWQSHILDGAAAYRKPAAVLRGSVNGRSEHAPRPSPAAVRTTGPKPTRDAYEWAVRAVHHEAFDEAEGLLTRVLEADPAHAAAQVLLASLLASRQQMETAHLLVDNALETEPLLADAYYIRALLFMEAGCLDEARRALRTAIYCQRTHPLASFMLGNLYAHAGDLRRASRHWRNAHRSVISLKPETPVSDISTITAGQLQTMVSEQITGQRC